MTTDWKALCAELVDIATAHCNPDDSAVSYCAAVLLRARTALSQTEPQEPTDEEILNLSQEHQVSYTMSDGGVIYPLQAGADMKDDVLSFARALIAADRARWGCNITKDAP